MTEHQGFIPDKIFQAMDELLALGSKIYSLWLTALYDVIFL